MLSRLHELIVEMFHDRPMLAADLLTTVPAVDLPEFEHARLFAADLTDVAPTEYRADAVVTLDQGGDPVLAVMVEVQLRPTPTSAARGPCT